MNKNILSEVNNMREQMGLEKLSEEQAKKSSIINESVGSGEPFDKKVEGGKQTEASEGSVNTPSEEAKHTGSGAGEGEPFEKKTEGGKIVSEGEEAVAEEQVAEETVTEEEQAAESNENMVEIGSNKEDESVNEGETKGLKVLSESVNNELSTIKSLMENI